MSILDLTNVETTNFDALPSGTYPVYVDHAEFKKTKAGFDALNVRFKVSGSGYKGRVLFNLFNINNPSEKAKNIALSELKSLLLAGGLKESELKFASRDELLSKVLGLNPIAVLVTIEKSADYGEQNRIKSYLADSPKTGADQVFASVPNDISSEEIPF